MADMGERVATLEGSMKRVNYDLYGNGQPGLVPRLQTFLAVQEDREEQSAKTQVQSERRMKLWIAVGGSAMTAAHIIWDTVRPHLFH